MVYLVAGVDKEQALATLESSPASTNERLRAARFLAQNATGTDRNRLSQVRGGERNSWVRQALDQALIRSQLDTTVGQTVAVEQLQETPFGDPHLYEELRAQAIEETSGLFLHELRPLVGLLEGSAAREIDRYACSRTKTAIDRVRSFLEAIERLRMASAAPAIQEFDLTDLVARVTTDEALQGRAILDVIGSEADDDDLDDETEQVPQQPVIKLLLARLDPVITMGDPILVEIAVANALRNAIEAVLEVLDANRNRVILNWGVTDTDSWIVVLDEGCGLPSGLDRLTNPGTSTKLKSQGHLGMGLPIAQRAIESTRGSFRLTPRSRVGVACEIRWPFEGIAE